MRAELLTDSLTFASGPPLNVFVGERGSRVVIELMSQSRRTPVRYSLGAANFLQLTQLSGMGTRSPRAGVRNRFLLRDIFDIVDIIRGICRIINLKIRKAPRFIKFQVPPAVALATPV